MVRSWIEALGLATVAVGVGLHDVGAGLIVGGALAVFASNYADGLPAPWRRPGAPDDSDGED